LILIPPTFFSEPTLSEQEGHETRPTSIHSYLSLARYNKPAGVRPLDLETAVITHGTSVTSPFPRPPTSASKVLLGRGRHDAGQLKNF